MQRTAVPELPQEKWHKIFNQLTPGDLKSATLVCSFWHEQVEDVAERRFRKYFPELHKKVLNPTYQELMGKPNWNDLFKSANLQYCWSLLPSQITDYRAIRCQDIPAIEKILLSPNAKQRILIKDNQNKTIFHYLANYKNTNTRQAILNKIFSILSVDVLNQAGKLSFDTLYDEEIKEKWNDILEDFDETDDVPALLILALLCNKSEIVAEWIKTNNIKHTKFRPKNLLREAWVLGHIETFFVILAAYPKALFKIDDPEVIMKMSQEFAALLFQQIQSMDLGQDSEKRTIDHWAIILNQTDFLCEIFNQDTGWLHEKIGLYYPIDFACLWGLPMYDLLVGQNVNPASSKRVIEAAELLGDPVLLSRVLSVSNDSMDDALMGAATSGHLDCVKILLSAGAKITADIIRWTIIHRQIHVLEYLGEVKALKPDFQEILNDLAQTIFSRKNVFHNTYDVCAHVTFMRFFINIGMPANWTNTKGESILHLVVSNLNQDFSDTIRFLASNSAFIDAPTNQGQTPLHYAALALAENSSDQLVHFLTLIELGADCSKSDDLGMTPLAYVLNNNPAFYNDNRIKKLLGIESASDLFIGCDNIPKYGPTL